MIKYNEKEGNVFDYEDEYAIAHCISADLGLSTGLARVMESRHGVCASLQSVYGSELYFNGHGYCLPSNNGHIFNLIVQGKEYGSFTYEAAEEALRSMFIIAFLHDVKKIVMPRIGAGLAGLDWGKMREIIFRIYEKIEIALAVDLELEILVVYPHEDDELHIEEPEVRWKDNELSKRYH